MTWIDVPCPWCRSGPGMWCVNGDSLCKPHEQRRKYLVWIKPSKRNW